MRLKTFKAPTLDAAKAEIRRVLGDDAMISATRDIGDEGVEIICSVEVDPEQEKLDHSDRPASSRQVSEISRAVRWHEVPIDLADRLLYHIAINRGRQTAKDTLTAACNQIFTFHSLIKDKAQPILLFGPPGMGKTVSAAKLALKAKLAHKKPVLICADHLRTGAAEQLELYSEKLGCPIYHANSGHRLEKILNHLDKDIIAIIDSPGVNPFVREEMNLLKNLLVNSEIQPVMVLNTITDSIAGNDVARAFAPLSPRYMLISGMDVDRRLGRILSVADSAGLSLSYYSPRPTIVDGLSQCNAQSIAALLLQDIPSTLLYHDGGSEKKPAQKKIKKEKKDLGEFHRIDNAIAIASGKGGVGKTFLSATLAHALAEKGKKILLFDGDIGLANIDIQLGLMPEKDLGQVLKKTISLKDAICPVKKTGFDVLAGRSGSGRLASMPLGDMTMIWEELYDIASSYDIVLLDLGAGIERINQFLTTHAHSGFVVTNDEPTALTDAYAFLKIIYRQNPESRQYVVVNSASSQRQGERTFRLLEQTCNNFIRLTPKLAGIVRQDNHVHNAIRSQTPFLLKWPEVEAAKDIRKLADYVIKILNNP